jgi:hypothetical protein
MQREGHFVLCIADILHEAFNSFSNSATQMHLSCITDSGAVGPMSHQPWTQSEMCWWREFVQICITSLLKCILPLHLTVFVGVSATHSTICQASYYIEDSFKCVCFCLASLKSILVSFSYI